MLTLSVCDISHHFQNERKLKLVLWKMILVCPPRGGIAGPFFRINQAPFIFFYEFIMMTNSYVIEKRFIFTRCFFIFLYWCHCRTIVWWLLLYCEIFYAMYFFHYWCHRRTIVLLLCLYFEWLYPFIHWKNEKN